MSGKTSAPLAETRRAPSRQLASLDPSSHGVPSFHRCFNAPLPAPQQLLCTPHADTRKQMSTCINFGGCLRILVEHRGHHLKLLRMGTATLLSPCIPAEGAAMKHLTLACTEHPAISSQVLSGTRASEFNWSRSWGARLHAVETTQGQPACNSYLPV